MSSFPEVVCSFGLGVDYGLWINDPFFEIFSGPLPSAYAHNFTTGEVVPENRVGNGKD